MFLRYAIFEILTLIKIGPPYRRTEAPASARPQSPDPPAPRASVTGRAADRIATCGHRKPATDDAGSGLHLEQIQNNEIIDTNVPLQCKNEPAPVPHTGIFKIFHF